LRKPRAYSEVYNDLDSEIVNLFRVVRDRGEELIRKLYLTPYSREEFKLSYFPDSDPLEQARRTVIRAYMGFGSAAATQDCNSRAGEKTGFRSNANRAGTTPAHDWMNYPKAMESFIERLRGVVIENRSAVDIIPQHDTEETLFYADPPYLPEVRNPGRDYRHEMSEADHIELAQALNRVKGMAIISGYDSPLYEELYQGWRVAKKQAYADGARPRTEVLWMKGVEKDTLFSSEEES
jgi:DNA adenine methylase